MTDVLLSQLTEDGGGITYANGRAVTSDGLETAAYTSLFGGNERDSGLEADDALQWWGNLIEPDEDRKYRSRTQNLLRSLPLVPANLLRIEEAAAADLEWFFTSGLASFVSVTASIPAVNTVRIVVEIVVNNEDFKFVFTEQARAAA